EGGPEGRCSPPRRRAGASPLARRSGRARQATEGPWRGAGGPGGRGGGAAAGRGEGGRGGAAAGRGGGGGGGGRWPGGAARRCGLQAPPGEHFLRPPWALPPKRSPTVKRGPTRTPASRASARGGGLARPPPSGRGPQPRTRRRRHRRGGRRSQR